MYKRIAIIGLGTIGGFLSKNLAEIDFVEELVLIDYDIVDASNLKHSVYKKDDIGKFKTDAINSIIKKLNPNLKITLLKTKYKEGDTKIPKCNLVIDCRDFTYDRGPEIDLRLYVSSRYLIIDCRKDTKYQSHYEGKYIDKLTKNDILFATFNFSMFISNGLLKDLIDKRLVHKIELDYLSKNISEKLDEHNNQLEVIHDDKKGIDRLLNFYENNQKIIEMNKKSDLNICLGDKKFPLVSKIIPKNKLKNVNDVSTSLLSMMNFPITFNNYIVSPVIENKICYVILIPETGAA